MNTKKTVTALVILIALIAAAYVFTRPAAAPVSTLPETGPQADVEGSPATSAAPVQVIAENLEVPWDIAFLPGGDVLITERVGTVVRLAPDGARETIAIEGVSSRGEGGLLGLVLHPGFDENGWVYLYLSSPASGGTENRIERYRLSGNELVERVTIIEGIPGAIYHDGGRMAFGPDGFLYVTTGDATSPELAQDRGSLAGKILRLTEDGGPAPGNPFGTAVYSYGHRNPQGLAWDSAGRLWSTEHGRSGIQSGLDELNLIEAGANYGWPEIEGDETRSGMRTPVLNSGSNDTWAPASLAYLDGSLYFGGLRGEALYEAVMDGERVVELKEHFKGRFGRLRTVRVGPDGFLYLTTSNRDGRGEVREGDDKIIRIDPRQL